MKGKDWIVRLICCGRDDGTYEATSWAEADTFRASYVDAIGHERSAIIERAHTDSGADEERSAPPAKLRSCKKHTDCLTADEVAPPECALHSPPYVGWNGPGDEERRQVEEDCPHGWAAQTGGHHNDCVQCAEDRLLGETE